MVKRTVASFVKNAPLNKISRQKFRYNQIAGSPTTAYKFGTPVQKIELVLLSKNIIGPAVGLKKFWRQNLPTLKFHNEDVSFTVTRIKAETKAEIAAAPSKIIVHKESETESFDCAGKTTEEILQTLVSKTNATVVDEAEIPHYEIL